MGCGRRGAAIQARAPEQAVALGGLPFQTDQGVEVELADNGLIISDMTYSFITYLFN